MPTMPNVVGLELETAQGTLQTAGVINTNTLGYFGTWPITVNWTQYVGKNDGVVTAQNPTAGTLIAANSPIILTCSGFKIGVVYP